MSRPYIRADRPALSSFYFGFPHKTALHRWFTKRDLMRLRLDGYVIAKYKVHYDNLIMDQRARKTQCAFLLEEAELLEAA